MAAKKKRTASPRVRETLSEQIVVRVKPSMRRKLDLYVKRNEGLRGVGEAVRHVLDTTDWA